MNSNSNAATRNISLLRPDLAPGRENRIHTSKYTIYNFIPKNLFEQFSQLANFYFLVISFLQSIPEISNSGGLPLTMIPLSAVMLITAIKDAYEDYSRHKADLRENESRCVLAPGPELLNSACDHASEWQQLQPGMVVRVQEGERFPADILLLSSSEVNMGCSVETVNLDGESDLKFKSSALSQRDWSTVIDAVIKNPQDVALELECQPPSDDMYRFSGVVRTHGGTEQRGVDINNLLLRGTSLQQTRWILGLVVFCGHETRLMLNSQSSRFKLSELDVELSSTVKLIFVFQVMLCVALSLAASSWQNKDWPVSWYMNGERPKHFFVNAGTWLLQLNNLVPISLIVTITGVKHFQGKFISWDDAMANAIGSTSSIRRPASVHTSQVIESLGLVTHVFSDKTGTLTQNEMVYKACAVNGKTYGFGEAIQRTPSRLSFAHTQCTSNVDFHDVSFRADLSSEHGETLGYFLLCHALCHTVMPTADASRYNASSPDELALVNWARFLGLAFRNRDETHFFLDVQDEDIGELLMRICGWQEHGAGTRSGVLSMEILSMCEFDNDRKRMSVVVKFPNGKHILFVKGADASVLEHVSSTQDASMLEDTLRGFARLGLRTLCLAWRELDPSEFSEWSDRYKCAQSSISENRAQEVRTLATELETTRPVHLLGATAVEDRLQVRVPETIEHIRKAGVVLWVLTGDKLETAVSIGLSSKILTHEMVNNIVQASTPEEVDAELAAAIDSCSTALDAALTIAGSALAIALGDEDRRQRLYTVAKQCKVVIACRVSPKQKSDVVELVRKFEERAVTLSIGDGANDVSMIVAAHIGVGITGKEGGQAARAADFAISEFRHLQRLMFVHGRESYRRNANLALYTFYKTQFLTLLPVSIAWTSAYSGQPIYDPMLAQGYNILYSQLPIALFGIFDRAANDLDQLETRREGYAPKLFGVPILMVWSLAAVLQCATMVLVAAGVFYPGAGRSRESVELDDIWTSGNILFFWVVLNVNITMAARHSTWFWFTPLAMLGSVFSFLGCSYIRQPWLLPIVVGPSAPRLIIATLLTGTAHHLVGELLFANAAEIVQLFTCSRRRASHDNAAAVGNADCANERGVSHRCSASDVGSGYMTAGSGYSIDKIPTAAKSIELAKTTT